MGTQLLSPNSEAAIWARLMQAQKDELSREAAEFLLAIDFEESDRQRMLQLAERSEAGTLTPEELMEFDGYLHVGNLLAVIQSRAGLLSKRSHGTAIPREPGCWSRSSATRSTPMLSLAFTEIVTRVLTSR
jgi:hypothetical protein